MLDEGVELEEASRIEEGRDALARGHLALLVLGGDTLGPAALEDLVSALLELSRIFIVHTVHHPLQKSHFCHYALRSQSSTRTPFVDFGWRKAMRAPPAP